MWTTAMDYKKALEIQIILPKQIELGSIWIWNYNKSTLESIKGMKDIEVDFNSKIQ